MSKSPARNRSLSASAASQQKNEPAFLFPKSLYILLQNSSEKIFKIFLKEPVRNAFLKTYIG